MPSEEIVSAGAQHGAAVGRFAAAHRALLDDPAVQFTLAPAPLPTPPPTWLRALGRWLAEHLRPVGRMLRRIAGLLPDAPYARILLWTAVALAIALFAAAAFERARHGAWRLPRRRRRAAPAPVELDEEAWAPDAAPVRAWLREADALAAAGRYAEAAHLLLFRSVEDIARRRPRLVRPALTSRELAAASALPAGPRTLFADIAGLVERSLFGGRPVAAEDWTAARDAYTRLALAKAWQA